MVVYMITKVAKVSIVTFLGFPYKKMFCIIKNVNNLNNKLISSRHILKIVIIIKRRGYRHITSEILKLFENLKS